MSIIAENITKIYGQQKALDQVSINIKAGEVVGLLGPNGAGKSTLMKIITCFIPPTAGAATVNGYDVMEKPVEVRKSVGYLPENNPLYPDMYVKEYLQYISGVYRMEGNRKEQISAMIALTGLEKEQRKKIGALSKGYRQRVGLAQALLHNPDVLILDEPTSGLDPNQLLEIRNLIKNLGTQKTIMLSTHIMQEVEAICDRVIIIHNGKIVADETTENLSHLATSMDIVTVEFSDPVTREQLVTIPHVNEIKHLGKQVWELSSDSHHDIRPDIFQLAVSNNNKVLSMNKQTKKLEEVFQMLTKNEDSPPADNQ